MHGTPLFIRHGINDAQPADASGKDGRPRFTDVFFGRAASQLLSEAGVEHLYFEDDGGHSIKAAGKSLEKLVDWMKNQRRDPCPRRIIAQTPCGWNGTRDTPTPHHHWITIHDIGEQTLPFDEIRRTGPGPRWKEPREAFEKQGFKLIQRRVKAARVEAINDGNNRLIINTRNVARMSVWLHPRMADLSKPIQIVLNGTESRHRVEPSLLAALNSFQKHPDWSSVFHAELQLDVRGDSEPTPVSQWRGPNRDGLISGFTAPREWPDKLSRQ